MTQNDNLPPLPAKTMAETIHGVMVFAYTADQMREYGAECWRLGRIHGQSDTTPLPDGHRLVESREKISEHVTVLHLTEAGRKAITVDRDVCIPADDPVWSKV